MNFRPRRTLGLAVAAAGIAISLAAAAGGTALLAASPITPGGLLLGLLPVAGLAAAAALVYRAAGLWSAAYHIDRNGFQLQWGWATEQMPWSAVREIRPLAGVAPRVRPRPGLWWPGCVVGTARVDGLGEVDFFCTDLGPGALLMRTGSRHVVISPDRADDFMDAYIQATRQGVLTAISERSVRPDFLASRVWADRRARWLLIAGLFIPLALIGYLAVRSAGLPAEVPFGFDPLGRPNPAAPQGRLLLLPVLGLAFWTLNLVSGAWIYRREADRPISYAVWATALLAGCLLWGATLQMLAASRS
ncbi:MAG: PH domain-containing protein [Anaerolineales bacterium]